VAQVKALTQNRELNTIIYSCSTGFPEKVWTKSILLIYAGSEMTARNHSTKIYSTNRKVSLSRTGALHETKTATERSWQNQNRESSEPTFGNAVKKSG